MTMTPRDAEELPLGQTGGMAQLDQVSRTGGTPKPPAEYSLTPQVPKCSPPKPERFDWANDESVIIPEQPETALYWNHQDQIVIRQRCWPDDDTFVYFNRAHLAHLIAMLRRRRRHERPAQSQG